MLVQNLSSATQVIYQRLKWPDVSKTQKIFLAIFSTKTFVICKMYTKRHGDSFYSEHLDSLVQFCNAIFQIQTQSNTINTVAHKCCFFTEK